MMRSLWVSKSGMEAQQTQLDHISNNLANSGTNGFKQTHAVFEDLMYQNLRQSGASSSDQTTLPTGLQAGLGNAQGGQRCCGLTLGILATTQLLCYCPAGGQVSFWSQVRWTLGT